MIHQSPIARMMDACPSSAPCVPSRPGRVRAGRSVRVGTAPAGGSPVAIQQRPTVAPSSSMATPAQQAQWGAQLGQLAAQEVLAYMDLMYPGMWTGVPKSARRSVRQCVLGGPCRQALRIDRNTTTVDDPGE